MSADALAATLLLAATNLALASPCTLDAEGAAFRGACAALIEGADATVTLARSPAIVSGVWRRRVKPLSTWSGTLAGGEYPPTAVEIEIYAGGRGVMRTVFGWFPVSKFAAHDGSINFDVDAEHEVPASDIDVRIIDHADRILSSDAAWNRADDRKCPEGAATRSIYCALEKATVEVSGAFHHRRPALQVVRAIVDERTAGRPYQHRLMDYNNDPTTRLTDVHSLFAEARRRIEAQRRRDSAP